jgi:hypothetical protein
MNELSPDAAVVVSPVSDDAGDGRSHLAGRSVELVTRISVHEAGHAVCARALGSTVDSVSIVAKNGYEGRCTRRGAATPASALHFRDDAAVDDALDVEEFAKGMEPPAIGEIRIAYAEGVLRAQILCTELVAGTLAEEITLSDVPLLSAKHDVDEAFALAAIASLAPGPFLDLCRAEARAIIAANVDVVRALADALVKQGELDGGEVDTIIASTIARRQLEAEHARRRDWQQRMESAAAFRHERVR